MYTCVYVNMRIYACVCIYVLCICVCIYIYIYTHICVGRLLYLAWHATHTCTVHHLYFMFSCFFYVSVSARAALNAWCFCVGFYMTGSSTWQGAMT